jgi:hypothetical protein
MLLPLRRARTELRHFSRRDSNPRPPSRQAGTALYRSNRHLHHRQAGAFASAIDGYAGERAISAFSDDNTVSVPNGRILRRAACVPFPRPHPGACVKGGRHTRCAVWRSIRHLHHQRRLSRDRSRQTKLRKFYRGAVDAPHFANPFGFALPSVSGSSPRSLRQAPRTWARAFSARAPGSGSPVPAIAGLFGWAARRATKNPPERQAREGP